MKNTNSVFIVSWGTGKKEFDSEPKALTFAKSKINNHHLVTIKENTVSDIILKYSWIRGIQTVKKGRITRNSIKHPNWQDKGKKNPKWKDS